MATSSPGAVWLPFRHRGAWTLLTALLLAAAHDGAVVGGAEAAGPDDGIPDIGSRRVLMID